MGSYIPHLYFPWHNIITNMGTIPIFIIIETKRLRVPSCQRDESDTRLLTNAVYSYLNVPIEESYLRNKDFSLGPSHNIPFLLPDFR